MEPPRLNAVLVLLGLFALASCENKCRNEPTCRVSRVHGLKSADCYKLDLHHFPKCLTGDAEVIDLTYNRIRELSSSDLRKYKNLKLLYLGDNLITRVDPEAFADKSYLETLDLSLNGFSHSFPDVIFRLPSLKNLYLSQNQNINIIDIIEDSVPITSPLAKLDISYNNYYEHAQPLPKLGIIPTLIKYNVSGMNLKLTTADTAGLCNLQVFVNDNITASFDNPCDCHNIGRWLKYRNVRFTPLDCYGKPEDCPYEIPMEDEELFSVCKQEHAEMVFQGKLNTTLMVTGGVLGILLVCSVLFFWKWRRNRNNKRKQQQAIMREEFMNKHQI